MTDKTGELPLVIPISILEEYFQCSICLNNMTDTMTTVCGHRYCGKCIQEWVDRNHNCPCCNSSVNSIQLIKDHQFDSLIGEVEAEKTKAEANYFENLINSATKSSNDFSDRKFSPVEEVLKKHLRQSLTSHEKYFQSLRLEFTQRMQMLERDTERALQTLMFDGLSPTEVQLQTAEMESRLTSQKDALTDQLERCMDQVADAYDRYLTNHIPMLEILPVKVSVYVIDKNLHIPDVTIKASDDITHIQTVIEKTLNLRGDPLIRWGCEGRVYLVGPLSGDNSCDLQKVLADPDCIESFPDIHLLTWHCRPVLQYSMKPGSQIVVKGCFKCESDLPKICFVQKYKEQGPHPVDYFSCKNCGFNWICKSCVQICHQGHEVSAHVLNHKPTWACCYCPKKKKCQLLT
ncbi:uncharacterized protein [Haliotis cracherodii]|uniref:uncharacterized protein n=1 Tax=Haliotis cracherodii TaxID=6455 RepID=UPI0039EC35CD